MIGFEEVEDDILLQSEVHSNTSLFELNNGKLGF